MKRHLIFELVWRRIFGKTELISASQVPEESPPETPPEDSPWHVQEMWQECVDPELTQPLAYLGDPIQI